MGRLPFFVSFLTLAAVSARAQAESALVMPGFASAGAVQSYVRFSNSDGITHSASVMLHRPNSGEMLASWATPPIPAGGTFQIPFSEILRNADPPLSSANLPASFVIAVSGMVGHVQHATWTASSGAWSNMSTCGMALMADPLSIPYVSGPGQPSITGLVRVTNATAGQRAVRLTFSDNLHREYVWDSPAVPAMGSISVLLADIALQSRPPIGPDVVSLMAMSDSQPFGVALSYSEGASSGSTFDDFSAACMLAIASPVTHDMGAGAPVGGDTTNMSGMAH